MSVLQITIIAIVGFITQVTAAKQNGPFKSVLPDWYHEYRPGVDPAEQGQADETGYAFRR